MATKIHCFGMFWIHHGCFCPQIEASYVRWNWVKEGLIHSVSGINHESMHDSHLPSIFQHSIPVHPSTHHQISIKSPLDPGNPTQSPLNPTKSPWNPTGKRSNYLSEAAEESRLAELLDHASAVDGGSLMSFKRIIWWGLVELCWTIYCTLW